METERKEYIFKIFFVSSMIIIAALVMIFSYLQSKKCYDGSCQENLQEMLDNENLGRFP